MRKLATASINDRIWISYDKSEKQYKIVILDGDAAHSIALDPKKPEETLQYIAYLVGDY